MNMKKRNRFKECVDSKVIRKNKGRGEREKKYKMADEMRHVAATLKVNWWTALSWYTQKYQPRGENYYLLPKLYRKPLSKFYYHSKSK